MIDAWTMTLNKGCKAVEPKSGVLKTSSAWPPRCTPTWTPSAPSSIAHPMISLQRDARTRQGRPPMPRSSFWPSPRCSGIPSDRRFVRAASSPARSKSWEVLSPGQPNQMRREKARISLPSRSVSSLSLGQQGTARPWSATGRALPAT